MGLLRFGIPQRVDWQVRMELTVAPKLQTIRHPLWSVQEVQKNDGAEDINVNFVLCSEG